jgi:DnaJ-domain-containing protein 1
VDVFDRFGNLLRSFLDESETPRSDRYSDPDLDDAWEELNAYMEGEETEGPRRQSRTKRPSGPSGGLRRDFHNLEVPFGASMERVRQSYKRLLSQYHPDKHASDPQRHQTATEITKKLNESYKRIQHFYKQNEV